MKLKLAYGLSGLTINLPDNCDIIAPRFIPELPRIKERLLHSLRQPISSQPLHRLVKKEDKVVIVHTDITRATPNKLILPIILNELEQIGIPQSQITLINGLGTHRKQNHSEMIELLGKKIVENYQCLQHDPDNQQFLKPVRTEGGNQALIHRVYLDADVRILTGFIEPHFFAGFSGGPKSVLPAIAGTEAIHHNHSSRMLSDPQATWGITRGNPVWENMLDIAQATRPTFILNVALNSDHQITGVFAGDLEQAHQQGCQFVKDNAMIKVNEPYDIVITSNSGYPLDQNLYQSVKGISTADQITKNGGTIIIATACCDGLPESGNYSRLLASSSSPTSLLEKLSVSKQVIQEQWQVIKQLKVQYKADVFVYSDGLSDEQISQCFLLPCHDIEKTVSALLNKYGSKTRICALPQGPQTIPYLDY